MDYEKMSDREFAAWVDQVYAATNTDATPLSAQHWTPEMIIGAYISSSMPFTPEHSGVPDMAFPGEIAGIEMVKEVSMAITNETIRDVRYRGKIVIPAGTRVEVDDALLPSRARYEGKSYPVRLDQMSSHEIQIDGVYAAGCGPDA